MSVNLKGTPVLVRPNGSHWLELNKSGGPEVFSKEEMYPILELEAPRVGTVRAQFSVDRYTFSDGDWSDWRIILREVRAPDPERPELTHLGREAQNIGPATREAIANACRPIIAAWLESAAYAVARQNAATSAVVRDFDVPADYTITRGRNTLDRVADQLYPGTVDRLILALNHVSEARAILDGLGKDA